MAKKKIFHAKYRVQKFVAFIAVKNETMKKSTRADWERERMSKVVPYFFVRMAEKIDIHVYEYTNIREFNIAPERFMLGRK